MHPNGSCVPKQNLHTVSCCVCAHVTKHEERVQCNKDAKNHEKMHTRQIENQVHIQPSINYSREQTCCSELTHCTRKPLSWCTIQHVYVTIKQCIQFIGNNNDQGKRLYVWSTDMEHPVRTAYSSSHLSYKPSL